MTEVYTDGITFADAALLTVPDVEQVTVKVEDLTPGVPFSVDGGRTWFMPFLVMFGTVSVWYDHGRSRGWCVRIPAKRDDDALTLKAAGSEKLDVRAYELTEAPAVGLVFIHELRAYQIRKITDRYAEGSVRAYIREVGGNGSRLVAYLHDTTDPEKCA